MAQAIPFVLSGGWPVWYRLSLMTIRMDSMSTFTGGGRINAAATGGHAWRHPSP